MISAEPYARPTLLLVSGAPGSGKTQLSRTLSERLGLFHVSKAEIARGLDATAPGNPANHDRGWATYWSVLEALLRAGVGVIADQTTWRGQCDPIVATRLAPLAAVRTVHCGTPRAWERWERKLAADFGLTPDAVRAERVRMRPRRDRFEAPLEMDRPVLQVDTTDGYEPGLERIVAFVSGPA